LDFRELSLGRAENPGERMYKPLTFEPDEWPEKKNAEGSNCYSYALDNKDYHWSIPGHGFFSGITFQEYEKKFDDYFTMRPREFRRAMVDGAIRDGLKQVGGKPIEREGFRLLALFFPIEEEHYNDFHWYRKDDGGQWSQKRGLYQAQEIDDAGNLIADPKQAFDTHYKFHSFFVAPRETIVLSPSAI
jgi:hypothetical protein